MTRTAARADWPALKELLADALELSTLERQEWLERLARDRPELHRAVEDLLAHEHDPLLAHEESPLLTNFQGESATEPPPPSRIGPWSLVRELGHGGMGTVWLAERGDGELRQRAAIKLLRHGIDTADVLRRFRAERQILANLSHPNITRLLDAGSTGDGRPYVVLDLVDGEPIDAWCDRRRLGIEARLELVLEVCAAVSYAHRNLIVHRDLKPGNVLVTEEGAPRLVDFGIAKILGGDDAGLTASSAFPQPMTLRYASPEQLRGSGIGTATDVHGLGLLLYELLTGRRAFEVDGLSPLEVSRLVCDEPAVPPSQAALRPGREGSRGAALSASDLAARRGLDPARLSRRLRGDLDTIVLRALAKDPAARFPSVDALADDLRRHLEGRPLVSRPGSALSRAAKTVRRHRLPFALGTALFLALAGFAAALWIQSGRLAEESKRARRQAAAAEEARREAQGTADLLLGLFDSGEVGAARVEPTVVRELLAQGAARLDREPAAPLDRARLLATIATGYSSLGFGPDSEALWRRVLAAREPTLPSGAPEVAQALLGLARALEQSGTPAQARAELERAEKLLGPRGEPRLRAQIERELGAVDALLGQHERAVPRFRAALAAFERLDGPNSEDVASTLHQLGSALQMRAQPDAAGAAYDRSLAILEKLYGPRHRRIADLLQAQANLAGARGDSAKAKDLRNRALALVEATVGPRHPLLASALHTAAWPEMREGGDLATADARLQRALAIQRAIPSTPPLSISYTLESIGNLRVWQKRFAESERILRQVAEQREKLLGPDHPMVGMTLGNLGYALSENGHCDRATPYLRRALAINEKRLGHNHYLVAGPIHSLGACAVEAGRVAEGRKMLEDSLAILKAIGQKPTHRAYQTVVKELAELDAKAAGKAGKAAKPPRSASEAAAGGMNPEAKSPAT